MKTFLKIVFGSAIGCILASVLFFFICIGIASGLSSLGEKQVTVEDGTVLKFEFSKSIQERSSFNPSDFMSIINGTSSVGLNDIRKALSRAKSDDKIKGLYLDMENGAIISPATLEEVREAVLDFKESGKFVIAYASNYSQGAYYLATAADKIYITHMGMCGWQGMSTQVPYFKSALDKLGVEIQIVRHGKFKSAVEPFMLDKMSQENRLQYEVLMNTIWDNMVENVSSSRNISADTLNYLSDNLLTTDPQKSVDYGMIDQILYQDEFEEEMKNLAGVEEYDDINFLTLDEYATSPNPDIKKLEKDKIAIVYAYGDVVMGDGGDGTVSSQGISEALREAREDSAVKAVVFRINSPGGDALAAEVILREVELTKAVKPVISSFGDYAASGGYYIACKSDAIVSQPNTLTGSIGVFGTFPMVGKVLKDKLGVTIETVNTNASSDGISLLRPMNEIEKKALQNMIESVYDIFTSHVAQGRGMTQEAVDEIGQGRVWTGEDALKIGLVDELGNIDRAVALAAEKAGLDQYRVVEFPKAKSQMEQLMEMFDVQTIARKIRWGEMADTYIQILSIIKQRGVQARMEYVPQFNTL